MRFLRRSQVSWGVSQHPNQALPRMEKTSNETYKCEYEIVPRGRPLSSSNGISIVSYNVLCEKFSTPERFPSVSPTYLDYWTYRWPLLRKELAEFDSDIVCLQECSIERWSELKSYMSDLGYDAAYQFGKGHTQLKLASFWKRNVFRMEWWEQRSRALLAQLAFRDKPSAPPLYLVNVHLSAKPTACADRINQLRHAFQRLHHHIHDSNPHILVVGDFNSSCRDAAYKFTAKSHLDAQEHDEEAPEAIATDKDIDHPFAFADVYKVAGFIPQFTRKVDGSAGERLDFIWITPNFKVARLLDPFPDEAREVHKQQGLPNCFAPSDHLPVGAHIVPRNFHV